MSLWCAPTANAAVFRRAINIAAASSLEDALAVVAVLHTSTQAAQRIHAARFHFVRNSLVE